MIKALTLALAITGLTAVHAAAQTTAPATAPATEQAPVANAPANPAAPASESELSAASNPDDCLKAASELAVDAEARKLAEDRLDKIEDLLVKMETHCDAKQFPEALAVAKDIKSLIETR